ncbi:MAG: class I SAM-dependent methyltransferase [Chloroflexi bacterium]|nr:class I SAM-dependent methyltransferase [Chloroflexota bacterium]
MERIGADFYDQDYFVGGTKSAYEDYSLCSGVMRALADMVLEAYGPLRRVLDVGCAYGYLVACLRQRGVEAWGVDISPFAIGQAPREAVPYLCIGNLVALPFGDDSFDLVFSSECLEHVYEEEASAALSELARVSRGKVCALVGLTGEMEDKDGGHVNLKGRRWWEELMATYPRLRVDEVRSACLNNHAKSVAMKWDNRFFCLKAREQPSLAAYRREGISGGFFDEEYFDGAGTKSAYRGYTEEGMAGIFPPLAQLLQRSFKPGSALDCGCAKGYLAKALRGLGVDARGQDISSYAVERADPKVRPYLRAGSMTKLLFGKDSFDLVVSTDTLEHLTLSQIGSALAEMKRVGKRYFFFTICLNLEPDCTDDLIVIDPYDRSHITIANRNFWHRRFTSLGLTRRADLEGALSRADLCRDMRWNIFVYEKRRFRQRVVDFLKKGRERLTWQRLKGRVCWLIGMFARGKGEPRAD